MSTKRKPPHRGVIWPAGAILAILVAIPAKAQENRSDYLFFVGSGFLCHTNDSSACPAVTKSSDDSTYELSGAGTFNTKGKAITAAGTFMHTSPNGSFLESGIWTANELVSFESYAIATSELLREGMALGSPELVPRRTPMLYGSMPSGGLAVIRIRLLPMRGRSRTAVLQVNCALGKVPEERQTEGIRLTLQGGGGEFNQEISGRTMFVATRAGAIPASKPATAVAEPNAAPAGVQQ